MRGWGLINAAAAVAVYIYIYRYIERLRLCRRPLKENSEWRLEADMKKIVQKKNAILEAMLGF